MANNLEHSIQPHWKSNALITKIIVFIKLFIYFVYFVLKSNKIFTANLCNILISRKGFKNVKIRKKLCKLNFRNTCYPCFLDSDSGSRVGAYSIPKKWKPKFWSRRLPFSRKKTILIKIKLPIFELLNPIKRRGTTFKIISFWSKNFGIFPKTFIFAGVTGVGVDRFVKK